MLIAQISDLHVVAPGERLANGCDSAAGLERCVRSISSLDPAPAAVLATGDLADHGAPAEYRRLRELLAPLAAPVYLIPGNHDDRAAMKAAFGDHGYLPGDGAKMHYAVDVHGLRLIALDTVVPGEDGGTLDAAQLEWLDATLSAAQGTPAVVFMHHPPIVTGMRCMDEIALDAASAAQLGAVIGRHRQVERIVCGHVHRAVEARWHGTLVSICPSTAFQARLDLRGRGFEPSAGEPPAYQSHFWNGAELVTHTVGV
jgi:Icc protein